MSVTGDFLIQARAGEPVWMCHVREAYAALPESDSWVLQIRVLPTAGAEAAYDLRLPRVATLDEDEKAFVVEYFLGAMYNLLSTIGGRRVDFVADGEPEFADELTRVFEEKFGIGLPRRDRHGQARCINVIERMLDVQSGSAGERFVWSLTTGTREPGGDVYRTHGSGRIADVCATALAGLEGRTLLGLDVGGTNIRAVLAREGRLTAYKEFDWFPAAYTRMHQLTTALLAIVRLMRLEAIRASVPGQADLLGERLAEAMATPSMPVEAILTLVDEGEELTAGVDFAFDAIGMCFPDVVVGDRIVGGEVYKTRGIRGNPEVDYEAEFRELSGIADDFAAYVREDGAVGVVNDGPMGAFTAAVEMSRHAPEDIADGVFAHTLGTELGTGWVTEAGEIPDIPLEVYNCVIDLGSYPERAFHRDDVRSVLNFNSRIPGTLQKYTSQQGAFRLAAKYFPSERPELFAQLCADGLFACSDDEWIVPTEPADMRKPLLEKLMHLASVEHDPVAERIFEDQGTFLAAAFRETDWILHPATKRRVVFGKSDCFAQSVAGAARLAPELDLVIANSDLAYTPLMQQLRDDPARRVSTFAQAIGAIHYANLRRNLRAGSPQPAG